MQYVLDTHALIWYLTANQRLSVAAKSVFDEIDTGRAVGIVSVMVLAEILLLEEKKRTAVSFVDLVAALQQNDNFEIAAVTLGDVVAAKRLTQVPELFDRIIAALAVSRNATLVSRDAAFLDIEGLDILW
jgi:PIN domain nuclease of toxin-antitoxin system